LSALAPSNSNELNLLDPIPAVLTIGAIVAIGLAASVAPARRVMTIDPATSLRADS
jgi:ABC-type antimicrobial peptide transport system permease subunit